MSNQKQLNNFLDFAINDDTNVPDNPIYRALNENHVYVNDKASNNTIYELYKSARALLDDNNFEDALVILNNLYATDPSEENLLLLVLAKYKIAEKIIVVKL